MCILFYSSKLGSWPLLMFLSNVFMKTEARDHCTITGKGATLHRVSILRLNVPNLLHRLSAYLKDSLASFFPRFISHVRQLVPKLSSSLKSHKWTSLSLDTWLKEFGKGCLLGKIWIQSLDLDPILPACCSVVFQNNSACGMDC